MEEWILSSTDIKPEVKQLNVDFDSITTTKGSDEMHSESRGVPSVVVKVEPAENVQNVESCQVDTKFTPDESILPTLEMPTPAENVQTVESWQVDKKFTPDESILPTLEMPTPAENVQTVESWQVDKKFTLDESILPKLEMPTPGLDAYQQLVQSIFSELPNSNFCQYCGKAMLQKSVQIHEEMCALRASRHGKNDSNANLFRKFDGEIDDDSCKPQIVSTWSAIVDPAKADLCVEKNQSSNLPKRLIYKVTEAKRAPKTEVLRSDDLRCSYCNKMFISKKSLGSHVREICMPKQAGLRPKSHSKIVPCRNCGKSFSTQQLFESHLKDNCFIVPELPYSRCDCGLKFPSRMRLNQHEKFRCKLRRTSSNSEIAVVKTIVASVIEEEEHSAEVSEGSDIAENSAGDQFKSRKCSICGKKFSRTSSLHRHLREVCARTDPRLTCPCGMDFSTISGLRRHQGATCRL